MGKLILSIVMSSIPFGLSACATGYISSSGLGNGLTSSTLMSSESKKERYAYLVYRRDDVGVRRYEAGFKCDYRVYFRRNVQSDTDRGRGYISTSLYQNNIFVTMDLGGKKSTALYTPNGTALNQNLVDLDGKRGADKPKGLIPRYIDVSYQSRTNIFPELFTILPRYTVQGDWAAGSKVANLETSGGEVVGEYRYRGQTLIGQRYFLAIDIVYYNPKWPDKEPRIIGFMIVDPVTLLPHEYVFEFGYKIRLLQRGCD